MVTDLRRRLLVSSGAAALMACVPVFAQRATGLSRVSRVGALRWEPDDAQEQRIRARYDEAMASLGHSGNSRISWEWRYAGRSPERMPPHAAELVAMKPDALLGVGSLSVRALANATTTIPIVGFVGDAYKEGYTRALGRPMANVTGAAGAYQEVAHKMMEQLKLVMPGLARFGIVAPAGLSITAEFVEYHEAAARRVAVEPVTTLVRSRLEVERAFRAMGELGIKAGFTPFSAGFFPDLASIARLALECRVALVDVTPGLAQEGGLLTFSPSFDVTRILAAQLDQVLRGTPIGEVPFQLPTVFRLAVNRKTAASLGISIPAEVLVRADRVID